VTDYSTELGQIAKASSLDEIAEIVLRFPARATGEGGALYSRGVGSISSEVLAKEIAARTRLPIINDTPRAQFLSSADTHIRNAAERIFEAQGQPPIKARQLASDFLYGDAKAAAHSATSLDGCLWGKASKEFASSLRGDVILVASNASLDRVFGKVELPEALQNKNIISLGGVSREHLLERYRRGGAAAVLPEVQARFIEAAPKGIFVTPETLSNNLTRGEKIGRVSVANEFATTLGVDSSPFRPAAELSASGRVVRAPIGMDVRVAVNEAVVAARHSTRHLLADIPAPWIPTISESLTAPVVTGREVTSTIVRNAGPAAMVTGVILDVGTTTKRAVDLHGKGNDIAAESEILHYAGRNLGMVGGAILGAGLFGTCGAPAGPADVLIAGAGAIGGAVAGDTLVDAYTQFKTYQQTDPHGQTWRYDPKQPHKGWTRTITDAFAEHGLSQTHQEQAPAELGDRLSYQASTTAVQLALGRPAKPDDPYTQPANAEDATLPGDPSWIRDAQTKQWSRSYVDAFAERGLSHYGVNIATPARTEQLDAAAAAVVANNHAQEPQSIAERYRTIYEERGWKQYGPMPEAVTDALETSATSQAHKAVEHGTQPPQGGADMQAHPSGVDRSRSNDTESPLRLDHPDHPGYGLFRQAQAHVDGLDAQHGRTPDAHSLNLAGFAAVTALANGITRIDALMPDIKDGSSMFVAQHTSPLKRVAEMSTLQAIHTPLETSSAQYLQLAQPQNQNQSRQQPIPMHDLAVATQTRIAPQMRV
jgi:hypothetical protein